MKKNKKYINKCINDGIEIVNAFTYKEEGRDPSFYRCPECNTEMVIIENYSDHKRMQDACLFVCFDCKIVGKNYSDSDAIVYKHFSIFKKEKAVLEWMSML